MKNEYLHHQLYLPCYNGILTLMNIDDHGFEIVYNFLTVYGMFIDLSFDCRSQVNDFFEGCIDIKDYSEQISLLKNTI